MYAPPHGRGRARTRKVGEIGCGDGRAAHPRPLPGGGGWRGPLRELPPQACRPGGGLGVWICYTVLKPPGEPAAGSLWCTLFDAAAPASSAAKVTLAPDRLRRPAGGYLAVGAATFEPGRVAGTAPSGPTLAAWELRFEPTAPAYDHFPRAWMYRAPVPRTKLRSPYPAVRVDGELTMGDRRVRLDGWPRPARRPHHPVRRQRRAQPGRRPPPARRAGPHPRHPLAERPDGCGFRLPGRGVTVEAPRKDLVGWVYADSGGGLHDTVNCSIATMRMIVHRQGHLPLELESVRGAAYELGMRERDHGVPLQPYPDGPQTPDWA